MKKLLLIISLVVMMPGCMPPDDPDEYKRWTRDRYDLEPVKKQEVNEVGKVGKIPTKEGNDEADMAPCS